MVLPSCRTPFGHLLTPVEEEGVVNEGNIENTSGWRSVTPLPLYPSPAISTLFFTKRNNSKLYSYETNYFTFSGMDEIPALNISKATIAKH